MNKRFLFFSLVLVSLLHSILIIFFSSDELFWQNSQKPSDEPIFLKFVPSLPQSVLFKQETSKKQADKVSIPVPDQTPKALKKTPIPLTSNLQNLKQNQIKEMLNNEFSKVPPYQDGNENFSIEYSNQELTSQALPMSGKLSILVYYGDYSLEASPIGKGYLEVIYPDNNTYDIKLSAKVVGWASVFFRKPLIFQSIGTINEKGLSPELYTENTPNRGESYVRVDNSRKTLYFSSTNKSIMYKNEELYDPLSLIFHLAWLSQKKLKIEFKKLSSFHVFNRKKLREIKLIADLPEEIVLPGGVLVEAIKIKSKIIESKRPGVMTFWLDPSDNFLPVRISYRNEKTKKTIDFLVLRDDTSSLLSEEKNNIKQGKKIYSHPYLPSY